MQIEVRTDNNIEGSESFIRKVENEVRTVLSRFSDNITHLEVHFGDENAN